MARGKDTSRDLSRQIKHEVAKHKKMFGVVVGQQDTGERGKDNSPIAAPVGGRLPRPEGVGPGFSNPAYKGADPLRIHLDTMREGYRQAMASLMIPPPSNERPGTKLVDLGMGRLSEGRERPVQSWVDETIKIKKD